MSVKSIYSMEAEEEMEKIVFNPDVWGKSHLIHRIPIEAVMQFLPLSDLYSYNSCSRRLSNIVDSVLFHYDPTFIAETAHDLVKRSEIRTAEKLLRRIVINRHNASLHLCIINRYLLVLHSEIWEKVRYLDVRREVTLKIKDLAMREYEMITQENESLKDEDLLEVLNEIGSDVDDDILGNTFTPAVTAKIKESAKDIDLSRAKSTIDKIRNNPKRNFSRKSVGCNCLMLFAYFMYKLGRCDSADKITEWVMAYDEHNLLGNWLMGVIGHYNYIDFNRAFRSYCNLISLYPNFAYGYYSLGSLLQECDEFNTAQSMYELCNSIDDRHRYSIMNNLLMSGMAGEDYTDKLEDLLVEYPTEPWIYMMLGHTLLFEYINPIVDGVDRVQLLKDAENYLLLGLCEMPNGIKGTIQGLLTNVYVRMGTEYRSEAIKYAKEAVHYGNVRQEYVIMANMSDESDEDEDDEELDGIVTFESVTDSDEDGNEDE